MSVHEHKYISKTEYLTFARVLTHVAYGRGLVLLGWHCNMLWTSGYENEVMFAHSGNAKSIWFKWLVRNSARDEVWCDCFVLSSTALRLINNMFLNTAGVPNSMPLSELWSATDYRLPETTVVHVDVELTACDNRPHKYGRWWKWTTAGQNRVFFMNSDQLKEVLIEWLGHNRDDRQWGGNPPKNLQPPQMAAKLCALNLFFRQGQ